MKFSEAVMNELKEGYKILNESKINKYALELENMDAANFTKAISVLPLDIQLRCAIMRKPITVWSGADMITATQSTQQVNYKSLARILMEDNKK